MTQFSNGQPEWMQNPPTQGVSSPSQPEWMQNPPTQTPANITPENYRQQFSAEFDRLDADAIARGEAGLSQGAQLAMLDEYRSRAGLPALADMDRSAPDRGVMQDIGVGALTGPSRMAEAMVGGGLQLLGGHIPGQAGEVLSSLGRNAEAYYGGVPQPQTTAGSIAGTITGLPVAVAPAVAAGGAAGLAGVGAVGTGVMSAVGGSVGGFMGEGGSGLLSARDRLEARGITGDEAEGMAQRTGLATGLVGTLEGLPVLAAARPLLKPVVGKVASGTVARLAATPWGARILTAAGEGSQEALVSLTDHIMRDLNEHDPDAYETLKEDLAMSAGLGAGLGGVVGGLTHRAGQTPPTDGSSPTPSGAPGGPDTQQQTPEKPDIPVRYERLGDGTVYAFDKEGNRQILEDTDLETLPDEELAKIYPDLMKPPTAEPTVEDRASQAKAANDWAAQEAAKLDAEPTEISVPDILDTVPGNQQDKFAIQNALEAEPGKFVTTTLTPDDFDTLPMENLDLSRAKKYAEQFESGTAPPIIATLDKDGVLQLKDGRHRIIAEAVRAKARGEDPNTVQVSAVVPERWLKTRPQTAVAADVPPVRPIDTPHGPSSPADLPAKVEPVQIPGSTPRMRAPNALIAAKRAFEASDANRPADWVRQRDRLAAAKGVTSLQAKRAALDPLRRAAKRMNLDLGNRATQYQITEALVDPKKVKNLPPEIQAWRNDVRDQIDKVEAQIVAESQALGMSDMADAVERRMGTYLASVPIKHANKTRGTGGRRTRLPESFGKFRRDAYVLTDGNGEVVGRFDTESEANMAAMRLRAEKSGKSAIIDIHEPLPKEWRMANEVHDPRFLVGRTMVEGRHALEMLRLIRATQPHTVPMPKGLISAADIEVWAKQEGVAQLPTDAKLGPVSGKFVPERMANDISEFYKLPGQATRIWLNMLTAWKLGKTVFNVPTHGRNVISNAFAFSYLGDVSIFNPLNAKHYAGAARDTAGRKGSDWQYLADHNAVNTGGRVSDEMRGVFDMRAGSFETYTARRATRIVKRGGKLAQEIYGFEDDVFKVAAFKKYKSRGLSDAQALAEVRKWFPDPSRAGQIARILRNLPIGSPFITFTDQALRIAGRAAKEKPIKLLAVAALPLMIEELSRAWLSPDKEDLLLLEGRSWAEPLLPWRSSNGQLLTYDMRYSVPLINDILPTTQNGTLQIPVFANNPVVTAIGEQMFGLDRFTGRKFVREDMSLGDEVVARVKQGAKTLDPLPPMLTWGPRKISKAAQKEHDDVLAYAILSQLTGVNIRTPYIRERHVRRVITQAIEEGEHELAASVLKAWNDEYRPDNLERLQGSNIVSGMKSTLSRRHDAALKRAAEALMAGDRSRAKQILKEYNAGKSGLISAATIAQAQRKAETLRSRGKTE